MTKERERLQFGIGCFYFTERQGHNTSWKEAVRESLAAIPRVSDIEFDLGVVLDLEIGAAPGFYPQRGMLRFRLHLPHDEQERLHEILKHLSAAAEYFVIMIYFRYFEPVVFIVPQASVETNTFAGMIAVREYLRREFSRLKLPAEMRIIGPTPFHADLSVNPANIDHDFELVRGSNRKTDQFTFLYSTASFSSPEVAAVTLFDRISDELSLYYSLLSEREGRGRERTEILTLVQDLIDIYQAKGLISRLRRTFTSGTKIRQATLKAVNAEYESQDDEQTNRRKLDELYSEGAEPYFKDFLEDAVNSNHTSTILAAREMVSVLDQARQRQVEVTSLFLSAVAGGLAGALVSLLVH